MSTQKSYLAPAIEVGPRTARVQCSSGSVDRDGVIVVQAGILYPADVPLLWQHQPGVPIGRAFPFMGATGLCADIRFSPVGISAKADEICAQLKAGDITDISIGFDPLPGGMTPIDASLPRGAQRINKCELLEVSVVSIAANPECKVITKAWKCGTSTNLPVIEDLRFDALAATASIKEWAGGDITKARKGFLAVGADDAVLFPIATVIDGRLTASAQGLKMASQGLPEASDLPEDVMARAVDVLECYASKPRITKAAVPAKRKDLYDCGFLASMLADLSWLEEWVEYEAEQEGDGSPVPQMLANVMRAMGEALIAMTAEEVAKLLKPEADEAGKAFRVRVSKAYRAKSGKVISAATMGKLAVAHGHATECMKSLQDLMDTEDTSTDTSTDIEDTSTAKMISRTEHYRRKAILAAG